MNETLRVTLGMDECVWKRFRSDLEGLTPEEARWRPLPEANRPSGSSPGYPR